MMKKVAEIAKHRCPLCVKLKASGKDNFVMSEIHGKHICRDCAITLADLTESKDEPMDNLYRRSKSLSGLEFSGFKKKIFQSTIDEFRRKLNAPHEEREKRISEEQKFTWATRKEVLSNWKRITDEYSSLLGQIEEGG